MISSIGWRMEGWKTYYFLQRKNWKCLWKNDSQKGDHFSVRYRGMLRMREKERKVREKRRGINEEIERWIELERKKGKNLERKSIIRNLHFMISCLLFFSCFSSFFLLLSSFLYLVFFFFCTLLVLKFNPAGIQKTTWNGMFYSIFFFSSFWSKESRQQKDETKYFMWDKMK